MKNVEHTSPILSPDTIEKEDVGNRGRSRRRTAKEIAQMFEQLKQRHLTRKKEWHAEKEELVKQAALANESKRILMELKRILKDLKTELQAEEEKREEAEKEFLNGKDDWELEKASLLKIIEKLESQRFTEFSCDKRLLQELDSVKSQLLSKERELTAIRRSNSNNQKNAKELRSSFEVEKQKLILEHEGEKRNWEKTREVMLERIEQLQQQAATKDNEFPLHGSHVSSPFADTSSRINETSSREEAIVPPSTIVSASRQVDENVSEEPTVYNQFQRTVDEALNQIEKISLDLSKTSAKTDQHLQDQGLQLPSVGVLGNTPERIRSRSLGPVVSRNITSVNTSEDCKEKCSLSSPDNKSDMSRSPSANYSCAEQKKICERMLTGIASNNYQSKVIPKSPFAGSLTNSRTTTTGTPEMTSSAASISPASCSLPGFTESSADSPYSTRPLPVLPEDHANPIGSSGGSTRDGSPSLKSKKRYSKTDQSENLANKAQVSQKKLPGLHQTLLFGAPAKSNAKQSENTPNATSNTRFCSPSEKSSFRTASEERKSKLHSPYLKSGQGYKNGSGKLSSSPGVEWNYLSSDPLKKPTQTTRMEKPVTAFLSHSASADKDFVKIPDSEETTSNDFVQKQEQKSIVCNQDFIEDHLQKHDGDVVPLSGMSAPPTRPKPNVTIEKDVKGNVLRIISDPNYQRLASPKNRPIAATKLFEKRSSDTTCNPDHYASQDQELYSSPSLLANTLLLETKSIIPEKTQDNIQSRESLGTRGKTWIKKRLPFFDAQQKGDANNPVLKDIAKKSDKTKNKSRSSSLKRSEERKSLLEVSTSEESEGPKGRERFRKRRGRKEHNQKELDAKNRTKRYTRSKTDSPLEMRNLLSKFRASQFNSKKPSIVKQFERRLLENEIKTLDDDGEKQKNPVKPNESTRTLEKVCDKPLHDDDGYRGEDELEYNRKINESKEKITSTSIDFTPTSSNTSSYKKLAHSKIYPKPRFHKSLMDLNLSDEVIDQVLPTPRSFGQDQLEQPTKRDEVRYMSPKSNYQFVRTSFSSSPSKPDLIKPISPAFKELSGTTAGEFIRAEPGRQSLPITKRNGNGSSKRLSWATDLESRSPTKEFQSSMLKPRETLQDFLEANDDIPLTRVSSVNMTVKRPEAKDFQVNFSSTTSLEKEVKKTEENDQLKVKGRMSSEMMKKAANLERVFKKGPSKPRRYRRSETQPIAMPPTTSESESESETSGMVRSKSMSSDAFAKEFLSERPPDLTSRFKKPILSNRRLPSRWEKKV